LPAGNSGASTVHCASVRSCRLVSPMVASRSPRGCRAPGGSPAVEAAQAHGKITPGAGGAAGRGCDGRWSYEHRPSTMGRTNGSNPRYRRSGLAVALLGGLLAAARWPIIPPARSSPGLRRSSCPWKLALASPTAYHSSRGSSHRPPGA
jgi:hypothetical protein